MHNREHDSTKWGRINLDRALASRAVAARLLMEDAQGKPVTPKIAPHIQSTVLYETK
jgi:hypothetical protein